MKHMKSILISLALLALVSCSSDAKTAKIEGAQVSISDQTMQSVFFHAFPVSRLSQVVKDPALAEALANLPDRDFTATYRFFDLRDGNATFLVFFQMDDKG